MGHEVVPARGAIGGASTLGASCSSENGEVREKWKQRIGRLSFPVSTWLQNGALAMLGVWFGARGGW